MPSINTYVDFYPGWGVQANSYGIRTSQSYILIDPVLGPDRFKDQDANRVHLLLATHGHFDHNLAVSSWFDLRPDLDFYMTKADKDMAQDHFLNVSALFGMAMTYPQPNKFLEPGQSIALDDRLSLDIFSSPGHSPGSALLLLKEKNQSIALFTGDVVFQDSIGRTDLPGGSPEEMASSLVRLKDLGSKLHFAPQLPILSGHGPDATWSDLLSRNPWL